MKFTKLRLMHEVWLLVALAASYVMSACGGSLGTPPSFPAPQNNPVPSISGISPNSATAGGPDFNLSVDGSNFVTPGKIMLASLLK